MIVFLLESCSLLTYLLVAGLSFLFLFRDILQN